MTLEQPVWFITGCSSGFGRALAEAAIRHGFRVIVTARNLNTVADIVRGHEGQAVVLPLDVTSAPQITAAVEKAEKTFGSIDVLVNNAGYGYYAAVEEGEDKEVRALFDTNFFGLANLTRHVLPIMRARQKGFIVNVTSVGGLVAFMGSAYYAATKFAVEALSEALAKEVNPLGIKVLIVEPGPFRTDFAGRSLKVSSRHINDYDATVHARVATLKANSGKQAGDPAKAAEAIIQVVQSSDPPLRLVLGKFGVDHIRAKLEMIEKEMQQWKDVTSGADFPG
jgi:NAD(P)-dependent dehydrogenase (short-subunit alcohol dehydrogenase family)